MKVAYLACLVHEHRITRIRQHDLSLILILLSYLFYLFSILFLSPKKELLLFSFFSIFFIWSFLLFLVLPQIKLHRIEDRRKIYQHQMISFQPMGIEKSEKRSTSKFLNFLGWLNLFHQWKTEKKFKKDEGSREEMQKGEKMTAPNLRKREEENTI